MGATRTPDDLAQPVEEMTNAARRGRIAHIVGCKTNWESPLDKRTLNSVHAYLTGEFYTPPGALNTPESPDFEPRADIMVAVAAEADIADPESWAVDGESTMPKGFRSHELVALIEELKERGDRRSWTND
jgi:hypothetical protein